MLSVTSKLVVTGCCSCTATYSISARKSAAPLIGQFFVSHCISVLAQQAANQHFVAGILPISSADDALHDDARAIDQVALRYAEDVIGFADPAAGVLQDVEREAELVRKRQHLVGAFLLVLKEGVSVDADRGNPKVRAGQLLVQLLHRRHLGAARWTPRRPNVDQNHLAAIVAQRGRALGPQVGGLEGGRTGSDLDRVQLRPQLDRQRDAKDRRRHQACNQGPLLPVRHTVTMQRRRSSWTSRPGSALAKIALPATNVSAPAWCASAIVCFVIPPSTSKKNCAWCVVRRVWAR